MEDTGDKIGAGVTDGDMEMGDVGTDALEETEVVDEMGAATRGSGMGVGEGLETGNEGVVGVAGLEDGGGLEGALEEVPT